MKRKRSNVKEKKDVKIYPAYVETDNEKEATLTFTSNFSGKSYWVLGTTEEKVFVCRHCKRTFPRSLDTFQKRCQMCLLEIVPRFVAKVEAKQRKQLVDKAQRLDIFSKKTLLEKQAFECDNADCGGEISGLGSLVYVCSRSHELTDYSSRHGQGWVLHCGCADGAKTEECDSCQHAIIGALLNIDAPEGKSVPICEFCIMNALDFDANPSVFDEGEIEKDVKEFQSGNGERVQQSLIAAQTSIYQDHGSAL